MRSKEERPNRTWKKRVEVGKCDGWCEKGRCTLLIKVEC